jgi:hypothetical protein
MEEKLHIGNLSDSDFISFLYSERERENSLSGFHGWNNWALAGAIVTVICSGYAVLKLNPSLDVTRVLYNTSCLIAFFLAYHSWTNIFRRERAVDFSKVRMMKEVIPIIKLVFVFVCAIASSITIAVVDRCNVVFWLWVSVIAAYMITLIIALCTKEKVVPSLFREMMLPWAWINAGYEAVIGAVFSLIGTQSFRLARRAILIPEFEFAACVAAFLILLYILFSLNFGNKVVRRFDAIIDRYLYAAATKEETFHEISKNRMGYGVLDACYKELKDVEKRTKQCEDEEKELAEMREYVMTGNCDLAKIQDYDSRVDRILVDQQAALNQSKRLVNRMNEIVKVSSSYGDITEIKTVFDTNQQCFDQVKSVSVIVKEVSRMLHEKETEMLEEINAVLRKELEEKNNELRELKNTDSCGKA